MTMKFSVSELNNGITLRPTTVSKELDLKLAVCPACQNKCTTYQLSKPFLIAVAKDTYIQKRVSLAVNDDALKGMSIDLGEDITHSWGRAAPRKQSVGDDEATLRAKMLVLLKVFASGDADGMAKRLFDAFLKKNGKPEVFTDAALDRAAGAHENITAFCARVLAAPGTAGTDPKKTRIHQALKKAGWDISKVRQITDLGVPAFNNGDKILRTGDFNNGLGVMINGVQYVFVYAEKYDYSSCEKRYEIGLKFVLYDVFGLDDDDLDEYGAKNTWGTDAQQGITAWWQLQHQFDYAPVLTRAVVRKTFVVSTDGE
jgi:hypothetical protein